MDKSRILREMTLEEKASLCSGLTFWKTKPIERLGIQSLVMSDGPYGIRKQSEEDSYLDFHTSKSYICFPTAAGMAASFHKKLWHEMGIALGKECRAEQVDILLGPAVNIKRSPLGGRNFEYLSEDPYVAGVLAAEYVKGLQDQGTSACVKHFAVNNQETRRMSASSNVDDRTLFEIYLSVFERIIKEAKPDTVMCSYNRINHVFAAENKWLIHEVLREKWGFKGAVITDWGAICDRVKGLLAGVDIEMPASGGVTDIQIVEAVRNGSLPEEILDETVLRVLKLAEKHQYREQIKIDREQEHDLAEKIAEESIVLLKNQDQILPLPTDGIKVAMIGEFAENPRYEGGGSSHINSWKVDSPLAAAESFKDVRFRYVKGYLSEEQDENGQLEETLLKEAVSAAKEADYAVIFAGLPESFESESYDRVRLDLPSIQNLLIRRVAQVQPNVVVVLQNGSPVTMPWISQVAGVLEAYLSGEAGGRAVMNILFGKVNPSGHLAETFPLNIEDTPTFINFPGYYDEVDYKEGVFIGYRYYLSKRKPVLFPFGYGLSYTEFTYSDLQISADRYKEGDELTVQVTVKNTGKRSGQALVQLYVEPDEKKQTVARPLRELKGFEKVSLSAGEEKRVNITMDKRSFAFYDVTIHDWYIDPGFYKIQIGEDCEKILLEKQIYAEPVKQKDLPVNRNTLIGDLLENPATGKYMEEQLPTLLQKMGVDCLRNEEGNIQKDSIPPFVYELPIRSLISFTEGSFSEEQISMLIEGLLDSQKASKERS